MGYGLVKDNNHRRIVLYHNQDIKTTINNYCFRKNASEQN